MNKSLLTNLAAALIWVLGYVQQIDWLMLTGLFALSGALTNWLAVYMLFEKVPGLVGSGVVPNRFEEIKQSLHNLLMTQFFSQAQIDGFLNNSRTPSLHLAPIIEQVDLTPAYDKLVQTIMDSSFGSMLNMFGGQSALTPLKDPFIENLKGALVEMSESAHFHQLIQKQIDEGGTMSGIQATISEMVQQRLAQLTPNLVKQIMQNMIQQHLGWLVVWGGVFGGVIGALSSLVI